MGSMAACGINQNSSNGIAKNQLRSNSEVGFVLVEDILELEPILTSRLPDSAYVLNAVKLSRKWGSDYQCYAHGLKNPSTAWIAVKSQRSDFGGEILISRPQELPIPSHMRDILKRAPFMNWDEAYMFAEVDQGVSSLVADISIRDYGNATHVHPCYLFYLEIEEAMKLNPTLKSDDSAQFITLSSDQGIEFMMTTWKYATDKSRPYMEKVLKRNPSSGVLANGKIVSGAGLGSNGLISMLHTVKEARGKGYAMATMHSLMRAAADQGIIPTCTVETRNLTSKSLQQKLGFKEGPIVDFVLYTNQGFD